ncbi:MAG: hypothetical protein ACYC0X_33985 [Pirellulaceae bacterium]
MGTALQPPAPPPAAETFEQPGLADLCREAFEEPWLLERVDAQLRTKLLRLWAADCHNYRDQPAHRVGAKHPLLCLMGREFRAAWNEPHVISVVGDRDQIISNSTTRHPRWPLDAVIAGTDQLLLARELFLGSYEGRQLRVPLEQVVAKPQSVIDDVGRFLEMDFEPARVENARSFLRGHAIQVW